jgi:hypothetical protein
VTLAPARWIWLPSERTLPNTFVLFRREVMLDAAPLRAPAWITADSRYRLTINGRRVLWGPAPCDPRQLDVDPVDLAPFLHRGRNVIGVEVLHYGIGEGTWPAGKPGLLFKTSIVLPDGKTIQVLSDPSWQCALDRAHRPGQYKRWFLRTLQEEFDARRHPFGWDTDQGLPDSVPAMVLNCPADKPSSCSSYAGNDGVDRTDPARSALRLRQVPALREEEVSARRLAASGRVDWLRDPEDWFEMHMPGSFRLNTDPVAQEIDKGGLCRLPAPGKTQGVFALYEFAEQIVGWPYFTIDASAGTIVDLMWQESHDLKKPAWLDTHFFSWARFICREGENRFETFDYESLRWLQVHVRNASRPVTLYGVGVRRRLCPWTHQPHLLCSDPQVQKVFDATVNTLRNCAQETCVDGMGRERQQYSGDGGHQLYALRYACGETRLPARFLRTFSEGQTPQGYFLDTWPAFDRLARVSQRQIDAAYWGPLLDHGVGFVFDCWNHYLETGDRDAVAEAYPRLLRFAAYLTSLRDKEGLLPVENLGVPNVWIDHDAYHQQRHKQCAFNLYAAAMLRHALRPLAEAMGDRRLAEQFLAQGDELLQATVRRFWSAKHRVFVNNLPWLTEEKNLRLCDRSLATAVLFDQCPKGDTAAACRALVECPPEMGLSYPCNACWRYWALGKLGRAEVIVRDFRQRWAPMASVRLNNTLQESWLSSSDGTDQWSHCAVAPLFVTYTEVAGIRPTAPGFARCQVRPQLGDLDRLDLEAYTVRGPIRFLAKKVPGGHRLTLTLPAGCQGELLVVDGKGIDLPPLPGDEKLRLKRFQLEPGKEHVVRVASP